MINDPKLQQDMFYLLGQIDAACFPMHVKHNHGYGDLMESIKEQYVSILKRTVGYEE
jgi:hypothetical protein